MKIHICKKGMCTLDMSVLDGLERLSFALGMIVRRKV